VPRKYFCDVLDDDVRTKFENALETFRVAGASIDDVEIHNAEHIAAIYLHLVLGDAAAYHAKTLETIPERYTTPVRERLEMGRYVLAEDYVRALNGRAALTRQVDAALTGHEALVLPTLPIVAPPIGAEVVPAGPVRQPVRNLMLRLTQLFNLTGHPAISLPWGFSPGGLPCGVQLVGARGDTEGLLRVALSCEDLLRQ
jgi:aspartyl-tRNA(Asn)/glutamyl-tRNA(Gln) amidotransferase subunit A